jgi:hypothetical protein
MIMCDFCALSPDQRKQLLQKFHSFLRPEGSVLLDVYSLPAFEQRQEAAMYQENLLDGFFSANKYYGFLNTFKYEEEKVVLDKYTIIEAAGMNTIYNWLQYFSPESLRAEFTQFGFTIDSLFANVAGEKFDPKSSEFAIVAKKQ